MLFALGLPVLNEVLRGQHQISMQNPRVHDFDVPPAGLAFTSHPRDVPAANGTTLLSGGPSDRALPPPKNPMVTYEHLTTSQYGFLPDSVMFLSGGPHPAAVRQGQAGDCYFLAALASLAHKEPNFVRSMVRRSEAADGGTHGDIHGDSIYSVRFFHGDARRGGSRETWIDVDPQLPLDGARRPLYAQPHPSRRHPRQAIWAPLIEKAFARFNDKYRVLPNDRGGYEAVGSGAFIETGLRALTGRDLHFLYFYVVSDERVWSTLNLSNRGAIMTASSIGSRGRGIPIGHVYSVLGTQVREGHNVVVLRDPYGCCTPDDAQGGNGVFFLSVKEFRESFNGIAYVHGDTKDIEEI